ncbi:MAG: amidohydrolase family protein, partial [Kiloniellales bacterium]
AMGADFIKLLATGAITSTKYEKADAIQYRPDEIAEAVASAAANHTYVAAHAHALEGIRNAVECGCRSVEHGSFGDDAVYRLMAERETWLVPTVCTTQAMMSNPAFAPRAPGHVCARYESIHEIHVENLRKAHGHGVKVAMGSDAGTPGNLCGDNLQEVEVMVNEAGFSPADGIHAATLEAARLLRVDDRLGKIAHGYLADVIAVAENPLDDISALRSVEFVMKEGRSYKQDGRVLSHPPV